MDNEEATRTLAKELGERIGRAVVVEPEHKKRIINGSLEFYQIDNPSMLNYYRGNYYSGDWIIHDQDVLEVLKRVQPNFTNANYFFLESMHINNERAAAATPYALIGYSFGEYIAACLSGVFSIEDAIKLIIFRGQLLEESEKFCKTKNVSRIYL